MFCLSRSDIITLSSTTNKVRTDVIVAQPEPFRFEIDPIKQEEVAVYFGQRVSRKYKTCGEDSRVIIEV
jgi:hypothetical protein